MDLIERLLAERETKFHGGIYDITQKRFAYHSNKIEGSSLTENQVSLIYETKTIANIGERGIKIDDLIEMANHFKCFDYILDTANEPLTVGRLLLYKECLKEGIIPFIVDDSNKSHYYSALEILQLRDNKEPLLTYFQGEQKNYINDLKNKNFDGKINHAKEYSQKV